MEAEKVTYLSEEGLIALKQELRELKTVDRPRISAAIAEARAQGDLSENAEYDAAKEAQRLLESKITQLELTVHNARLIDERKIDHSSIHILSKVTVKNKKTGKTALYTLVSAHEADFAQGKISIDSPIGKGLLDHKVGDVVEIKVPAGTVALEVLNIER